MSHRKSIVSVLALVALSVLSVGCNNEEPSADVAQLQQMDQQFAEHMAAANEHLGKAAELAESNQEIRDRTIARLEQNLQQQVDVRQVIREEVRDAVAHETKTVQVVEPQPAPATTITVTPPATAAIAAPVQQ